MPADFADDVWYVERNALIDQVVKQTLSGEFTGYSAKRVDGTICEFWRMSAQIADLVRKEVDFVNGHKQLSDQSPVPFRRYRMKNDSDELIAEENLPETMLIINRESAC